MISLVGIILLIGIVKKNAIMMIDFAVRTAAALLGALPLSIGHGMGSELRRPLGIAIIGGLIVSQMLTLYTAEASTGGA